MTLIDAAPVSQGARARNVRAGADDDAARRDPGQVPERGGRAGQAAGGPLTDDLVLLESGLDSLCFAIIVATLEDELGFDPFTEAEDVYFPVTLGRLRALL